MARHEGGIFSRPRGKTGGLVFGAARTREGKMVTSRLLVAPSNPNTAAQQAQRGKFSYALDIVRMIGADVYQSDWNRAISQLPGFQSWMSILMGMVDAAGEISANGPEIRLGTLTKLVDYSAATGAASGELDLTWDAAVAEGSASDTLVAIAISYQDAGPTYPRDVQIHTGTLRSAEAYTFTGLQAGIDYYVYAYFRGEVGSAYEGMLSPAQCDHDAAHA